MDTSDELASVAMARTILSPLEVIMSFRQNEGSIDRALRVVLGIALLALTVVGPRTMWGLLGVVPLITGLVGVCPLYRVLGFTTCRMRPAS